MPTATMSQEGGEAKMKESDPTVKEDNDAGQPVQSPAIASKNATKQNSPASPPKQPFKESVTAKSAMTSLGQPTAGTKTEKPNESPEKKVQSETTNDKPAVSTGKKIQKNGKRVENLKNAMAEAEWGWRIKSKSGKKYEVDKVSGSKSAAPSKSTQADLDYGPYSRRYRDSWNPEYEWGYYGAYGEWRPEEEWPYYAPYGMEPSAPYYPFSSEPPCHSRRRPPFPSPSCPIHGYMRQRPAPQRSQGTLISIPIPISIPMPMPSGSSSGPVIINPPPPQPPQPFPPPAQPERRTTPLQDMTSFMMAMMLKETMKGSSGDLRPSLDSQDQRGQPVTGASDYGGRQLPSEPADNQPAFLVQQSPPSPEPSKYTGAIAEGEPAKQGIPQDIATNLGKKKQKKKDHAEKDGKDPNVPADNKSTKEERARKHKAVSKQGADEVISLGSSDSSVGNKSPTSGEGSSSDQEEEEEHEEEGAPSTAYGGATSRYLRHCCLLFLIVFLAGVIIGNVAYTVSPRRFSNFLCSLGIFKPDNLANVNLSLIDDGSELGFPLEDSASGRSIFDVHHEVTEEQFLNEVQTDPIYDYEQNTSDTLNATTRCNVSIICNQTIIDAPAMFTSTDDSIQRFLNFDDEVEPADSNDEEDESFKAIDFGSFLDTHVAEKRSTRDTASPFSPQNGRERAPVKLAMTHSALQDLLARFPQPRSDAKDTLSARQVNFNTDNFLEVVSTVVDRSAVTLGEYRVPSIPVVNTRPWFFEKAFKYHGRTDPPAIFHLNKILAKQQIYLRNLTETTLHPNI